MDCRCVVRLSNKCISLTGRGGSLRMKSDSLSHSHGGAYQGKDPHHRKSNPNHKPSYSFPELTTLQKNGE
jgi:hypothetical protein